MIDDPARQHDHHRNPAPEGEHDTNPYSAPSVDHEAQARRDSELREFWHTTFGMLLLLATAVTASLGIFMFVCYQVGDGLWKHNVHPHPGSWFIPVIFIVPVGLFIATMGVIHYNRRSVGGGLLLVAGALIALALELLGVLWLRR